MVGGDCLWAESFSAERYLWVVWIFFLFAGMAGVAPEGSQFDGRQYDTKMNEL